MENLFKRIVSLFICVVTCFSLIIPASAGTASDIGENVGTFAEWLYRINYPFVTIKEWWENKFSSSGDSAAYTDYVTTVSEYYGGTSFQNDGSVYLQAWEPYSIYYHSSSDRTWYALSSVADYLSVTSSYLRFKIPSFADAEGVSAKMRINFQIALPSTIKVSFPAQDQTNFIYKFLELRDISSGLIMYSSSSGIVYPGASPVTYNLGAGSYYLELSGFSNSGLPASSTWYTNAFIPPLVLVTMMPGADAPVVLPETRTGSLCGDYFYSGDNGSMTQAENIYLFDETNNIINNPATGTTATASSWKYDYETRTYTITATDGSTYTIVHGDESAEVTYTDSSNTTNIYNYYYGTNGGGGENPGEQPDKESIWDKLGKLLGSITDGFLEVVKAFLGKLLDSLTSLVDMINSKIGNIVESILALFDYFPSLFSGFTGFLAAVFPFLPQEFFDILILGAALAAVLLILKVLRK